MRTIEILEDPDKGWIRKRNESTPTTAPPSMSIPVTKRIFGRVIGVSKL
jgi:hypothetical protein